MKRLLIILITASVFWSCADSDDGDTYYESNRFVREFTVESGHWQLRGDVNDYGSYYMYIFDEPQLSHEVLAGGDVNVYYMFDRGTKHQIPLPYTENYGEPDMANPGHEFLWNETYSFDVEAGNPGSIAFYCHRNDFMTENRPQTAVFRMVVTW